MHQLLRRIPLLRLPLMVALALLIGGFGPAPAAPQGTYRISGMDLHDGTAARYGDRYYLYGTQYACGFHWLQQHTPFCGFGVADSTDLRHWSALRTLFSPADADPVDGGETWNDVCGAHGNGCFNPRMVRLDSGAYVLWFNAPADYRGPGSNAYYTLNCAGPAGPCDSATAHRPLLHQCSGNGDFAVSPPYVVCTAPDQTLSLEQLDASGINGTGHGVTDLAGLDDIEGPGLYQDGPGGAWILTYSQPNCGYCSGTGTTYSRAADPLGRWTIPADTLLSPDSCGGQPRTVALLGADHPYQLIDTWDQFREDWTNQSKAPLVLAPLRYDRRWHRMARLQCS